MITDFLKTGLVCVILFFYRYNECETKYQKYVKRFVRYATEDLRKYQTILIANTRNFNSGLGNLVYPISSELPTLIIDLSESKVQENFIKLPVFDEPRATTLFIYIEVLGENSSVSGVGLLDFLDELVPQRIRPKCLIISLCEENIHTYEKFLRKMWSERYLDVTVYQLAKEASEKGPFQSRQQVKAQVHRFNPFTDVYEKLQYSRQIEWLPNKLQNMNGYNLKGGFIDYPPYSRAKYNKEGLLVDYSGADVLTFMALSKVLNFSVSLVSSVDATIGIDNSKNKSASGMIGKCANNEINVFFSTVMQSKTSKQLIIELTRMLDWESIYAVVPIFPGEEEVVSKSTSYATVLILLILLVTIYFSANLLAFDAHHWEVFNILRVLLGMPVPREPQDAAARILFATVMALSFLFASNFFGGLTSTNLKITAQMEFKTFKDLDDSSLIPVINPNLFMITFGQDEVALSNLGKKTMKEENMMKVCGRFIKVYKNVSCVLPGSKAIAMAESFRDSSGHSLVKVVKQPFWTFNTIMILEKGSPYLDRLDQVIIRMIESGLRNKWTEHYSRDLSHTGNILQKQDDAEFEIIKRVENLRQRLLFIAIHGYLLSVIIFIGEIFIKKLQPFTDSK